MNQRSKLAERLRDAARSISDCLVTLEDEQRASNSIDSDPAAYWEFSYHQMEGMFEDASKEVDELRSKVEAWEPIIRLVRKQGEALVEYDVAPMGEDTEQFLKLMKSGVRVSEAFSHLSPKHVPECVSDDDDDDDDDE
jgi:hypothetical protein